jgi:hypothetical protein
MHSPMQAEQQPLLEDNNRGTRWNSREVLSEARMLMKTEQLSRDLEKTR